MSFITYDFKCTRCDAIEERMVRRDEVGKQRHVCRDATLAAMERLMPGPTTTFRHHDRSATKSRKKVSLRDPTSGTKQTRHGTSAAGSESLD